MSITPYEPTAPSAPPSAAPSGGYATNSVASSPAAAPTGQEPLIFVGWLTSTSGSSQDVRYGPGGQGAGYDAGSSSKTKSPQFQTASQLLASYDKMSHKDFLQMRNMFMAAGLASTGADPLQIRDAYARILEKVAAMTAQKIPMSPLGYLKNLVRMNGFDPSKITASATFDPSASVSGDAGPQAYTQTQKSVYDLSPEQARSTLEGAMTQLLGRAPSEAEIHDFINAAQTAARKHPTTATATFTPGDTGMTGESSSTVSQGGTTTQTDASGTTVITQHDGFSAADVSSMAERRAKNAPDYAEYQAVATYFPALMSMLGATTGG